MSPLWLVPGAVLLLGCALVLPLLRSATDEARLLAAELRRQRDVADALAGVRDGLGRLRLPSRTRR